MKRWKQKSRRRKVPAKFEESVNIVPCCRHIQCRMIRNSPRVASRNINSRRKRRAQELLTTTEAESKPAVPAETTNPVTVTSQANIIVQVNNVARSPVRQALQSAINSFKNAIKAVGSFAERKIPFWRGRQWRVIQKEA